MSTLAVYQYLPSNSSVTLPLVSALISNQSCSPVPRLNGLSRPIISSQPSSLLLRSLVQENPCRQGQKALEPGRSNGSTAQGRGKLACSLTNSSCSKAPHLGTLGRHVGHDMPHVLVNKMDSTKTLDACLWPDADQLAWRQVFMPHGFDSLHTIPRVRGHAIAYPTRSLQASLGPL